MGSRSRAGKAETKTKTTGMPLKAINCKLKRMPETARAKGERREEAGRQGGARLYGCDMGSAG